MKTPEKDRKFKNQNSINNKIELLENESGECKKFRKDFKQLIDDKKKFFDLKNSVRKFLNSFHIYEDGKEDCIINQAFLTGIEKTSDGYEVEDILAWLRKVCYNIVRNQSRKERKNVPLFEDIADEKTEELIDTGLLSRSMSFIPRLQEIDKEIIFMRLNNLSWKEISNKLAEIGHKNKSPANLRKRYQRALEKIRSKVL